MANVDDVHNMARQVERELGNLDDAAIDDRDRAAISEFYEHRAHVEGLADSTLRDDLGDLRRCAERTEKPLVEFESAKDAARLWSLNKSEYGVTKDSTNENYADILRPFLRWLHEDPDYGDYPFHNAVRVDADQSDPIDPDEILSDGEVRKMREAAGDPMYAAMIELWADTGGRLSAVLQLRRKHAVSLDPRRPRVKFSSTGQNQKGMHTEPVALIDSTRWLRAWLNNYHPDDHPDAPMFVKDSYAPEDRENGALDPTQARRRLKDIGERAGIDRDRVKIHGFRHVATTRMKRIGLDWDEIAHRTGWSDHSLAEMKRIYSHLDAEEINESIDAKVRGTPAEEKDEPADRGTLTCGNCPASDLAPETEYCPECGFPVGDEAKQRALTHESIAGVHEQATEEGFETTDAELIDALRGVRDGTADPDAVAAAITDALRADD